jgi:hypothetical protein
VADIDIRITLDDGAIGIAKSVAPALRGFEVTESMVEDAVVHEVASIDMVKSAVILRSHPVGPSQLRDSGMAYEPDESTRQER